MISLKDYAKENGVTYEAVRQQVSRYKKELQGHVHKQGRTRFLDDEAVAFLQEHLLREPIAVFNGSPDAALIEALKQENELLKRQKEALYNKLVEVQDQLNREKDRTKQLLIENKDLSVQNALLLEARKEPEQKKRKWWPFG